MIDQDLIPSRKWTSDWPVSNGDGHSVPVGATEVIAAIYNQAGDDYVSYADGDPSQPFAFDGLHAYADRCVWAIGQYAGEVALWRRTWRRGTSRCSSVLSCRHGDEP